MALTTLDPKTALVAIDLQKGLLSLPIPTAQPLDEIVRRTAGLAAAFRRHGLPVVLVAVAGGAPGRTDVSRPAVTPPPDWIDLIEELDARPDDYRVTKQRWGAFHGTSLDLYPRDHGVTQIVLAGVVDLAP